CADATLSFCRVRVDSWTNPCNYERTRLYSNQIHCADPGADIGEVPKAAQTVLRLG
ncbi:unnamed protein product, partial [Tilletia laevis]